MPILKNACYAIDKNISSVLMSRWRGNDNKLQRDFATDILIYLEAYSFQNLRIVTNFRFSFLSKTGVLRVSPLFLSPVHSILRTATVCRALFNSGVQNSTKQWGQRCTEQATIPTLMELTLYAHGRPLYVSSQVNTQLRTSAVAANEMHVPL